MLYRWVDLADRLAAPRRSRLAPPAALRFRVHGDLDLDGFLESGRQCSVDIQAALASVERDLSSFRSVLDFGCGCGRTLQWLAASVDDAALYGTDIDEEAIDWCAKSVLGASFAVNAGRPPLAYPDASFDLVYAVSVFTHLTESLQLDWLSELRRVTAPGGLVVVTVRGTSYASQLAPRDRQELATQGFVYSPMPAYFQQLFPSWYQTATMSEEYIRRTWSPWLEVLRHVPRGLDGGQDIVVLRKP
jgi:cyclopropane fatty-acyl-phospholipid synthase-like methyltransferase